MTTYIPSKQTKRYVSSQQGDMFGNIIKTRNIDFSKKGYISLAGKPFVFMTEAQDADFESPIFIASDRNTYYVCTSDHFFTLDLTSHVFGRSERTAGSPPTLSFGSDYAFFTADIHVSGTTMVCSFSLSGNTWTSRITGLSSSYPHPLCVSEHQQYLAVGNGNAVALYDASYSLITTCTIPPAHVVTWIRWRGNLLYFGTRNIVGGQGKMFVWDGSGTAAQAAYGVGSSWAMSACEYGDTFVVASQSGQLLLFTGAGFTPLRSDDGREAAFPIYYSNLTWGFALALTNTLSKIASRGMAAKGRKIFMFVDASISLNSGDTPSHLVDFPSGLWCFDPEIGLHHKAGADHQTAALLNPASVASNILELPSAQIYETGDPVGVGTVSGLTGDINADRIYYAIKVDSTHIKLANTPQEAAAGQAITITGTPGGLDYIVFNAYKSVGATFVERSGPVHIVQELGIPRFFGSEVLFGCDVVNNTGTTIGAVMSLGMGKNVGSYVTPKIQAENVTDKFMKLISKFPPLNHASRQILIKYRTSNRWGAPGRRDYGGTGSITWIDAESFTVNPKTYDVYSLEVGDEIEITKGAAAGYTAHVTAITENSATDWTIEIDEEMPDVTAADTSNFIWDNWTKYKVISSTEDAKAAATGFQNAALTDNDKWVQLKIELRGFRDIEDSVDVEEVMLLTSADQKYA